MVVPSTQSRSRHWSRKRVRAAGFVAVIAGTVPLVLSVLPVILPEPPALSGYIRLSLSIALASMYGLLAVASLGAYIRYKASIERLSRVAILILCAALMATGIGLISTKGIYVLIDLGILEETETMYALSGTIGNITTTVQIILFVFTSVVGVIFWRIPEASRLTASLFMLAGPVFFATVLFDLFPSVSNIGFPLYLGFVTLGAKLWNDSRTTISDG